MTVWKIGSRWSKNGDSDRSILSVFRRNDIVFCGKEYERFLKEVKQGDYFAIADGYTIVAVAKATTDPFVLGEYYADKQRKLDVRPNELKKFTLEEFNEALGVRVKIVDLFDPCNYQDGDFEEIPIQYKKMSAFCKAKKIENVIKEKYDKNKQSFEMFDIKSNTFSIANLIGNSILYIIPVYQRPYSWTDIQIESLLTDICNGFKNNEPMFIGTMQLSSRKYVDKNEFWQDVIDGQQRISTISIILKELSKLSPSNNKLKELKFNWIETHVDTTQSGYMESYFMDKYTNDDIKNLYAVNANKISELLEKNVSKEEIDSFADYILNKILFVVIETKAGLSKTLQIFNTINTAGLALNNGDLFKLRLYEYMRDILHQGESAFDEISTIYNEIDKRNKEFGISEVSIGSVLETYKNILIAKYSLNVEYIDKNWNDFFNDLFDSIFGLSRRFSNIRDKSEEILSIKDIKKIIDIHYEWIINRSSVIGVENQNPEVMFAYNLMSQSRYGRYKKIIFTFLYFYHDDKTKYEKLQQLIISLNKLFFINSISYAKVISEVITFMRNLHGTIAHCDFIQVFSFLSNALEKRKGNAKEKLGAYIADNATIKNLICKLSEYICMPIQDLSCYEIKNILFQTPFDIEHIHANADGSVNFGDNTLQNSIGNLTMLEQSINRSIGCKTFKEKCLCYKDSKFPTIRQISTVNTEEWNKDLAERRRSYLVDKMFDYLYQK